MTTNTILLIILSLIVAGSLSFFQYYYKANSKSRLNLLLAFLRFLSLFGVLVLLINPIIKTSKLKIEKPLLIIAVDNSSSIKNLKADKSALKIFSELHSNSEIQTKYDVQSYKFDTNFESSVKFNFKGTQTNLDVLSKDLKSIYKNKTYPTIIITDGNQTTGNDYVYGFENSNKIFPVVVGDTTKVLDLKVSQVNVNKYAFYKNKFPVEVFLQYSGSKSIDAKFSVSQGNDVLATQQISFSSSKKTAIINVLLPASRVGVQVFKTSVFSKENELNSYNNTKHFAVDIIDQKTKIALISSISHPDVGALKRSILSNNQREVTLFKPQEITDLKKYDIVIFYQPTAVFKKLFDECKSSGINTFIITGLSTDFTFLNQQQNDIDFKMSSQPEDYLPDYNPKFNSFAIENIGFENLPPLENPYGKITLNNNFPILLYSKIRNIDTNFPLLALTEQLGKRTVYLFGENSWTWRLKNHIDNQSYEKYDLFMDKIIQYIASNNTKKSLIVNHEKFYNSGEAIEISAQFFNKNYEFDEKAHLTINVVNAKTKETKNYDLLKFSNAFKVDLAGLTSGKYDFTIKELNSSSSYSGNFEILDFEIEKQFVNPDVEKLMQLATLTQGQVYFPNQIDALIKSLIKDTNYKSMQKSKVTNLPIIEWYWLLVFIVLALALEWFIRKYNGLL